MIKVRAIGAAEVQIGRRRITLKTELLLALAVYLAMRAGERVTRDEVVAVFWPDATPARGRHNLRQSLYKLRLRGFELDEDGEVLLLDPSRVECDVHALLSRSASFAAPDLTSANLEVLGNLKRPMSSAFRAWSDTQSARIRRAATDRLLGTMAVLSREGRWSDVIETAASILSIDPLNERATVAKAESLALLGSRVAASALLDEYASELSSKGSTGLAHAKELKRRLKAQVDKCSQGERTAHIAVFGQTGTMARISDAIDSALRGMGSWLHLWGPAGVGKSRLAAEARAVASLRGFHQIYVQCDSHLRHRPFSLAMQLARALRDAPGGAGAQPEALSLVRRLGTDDSYLSQQRALLNQAVAVSDIASALAETLSAVADEQPTLLTIEDAHNADTESALLLSRLGTATATKSLIALTTSRDASLTQRSPTSDSTGHIGIRVPPLDVCAAEQMIDAIWRSRGRHQDSELAARIARYSGGNPLFIRELAHSTDVEHGTLSLSFSLAQIVDARLSGIDATQLRILRIVCLLGPQATVALVLDTSGLDTPTFSSSIETLENEGILQLTDARLLRVHDCWAIAVREGMTPLVHSALALECARALSAAARPAHSPEALWLAAEYFHAGGAPNEARQSFLAAGDLLLARGVASQASAAFTQALGCGVASEHPVVLERIARSRLALDDFEGAAEAAQRGLLSQVRHGSDGESTRALLITTLAESRWRSGREHGDLLPALLEHANLPEADAEIVHAACLTGLRLVLASSDSGMTDDFYRASQSAERRSGPSLVASLVRIIWATERGATEDVENAVTYARVQIQRGDQLPANRALALRYCATALRTLGRVKLAQAAASEAINIASSAGALSEARHGAIFMTFLSLDCGEIGLAETWIGRCEPWRQLPPQRLESRQLMNASARLDLANRRFSQCLERYERAAFDAEADPLHRRALADLACIAIAAAECNRTELARRCLGRVLYLLEHERPSMQTDFPAEAAMRAVLKLDGHSAAVTLAMRYLDRRSKNWDRPIPAGMEALLSIANATGTAVDD